MYYKLSLQTSKQACYHLTSRQFPVPTHGYKAIQTYTHTHTTEAIPDSDVSLS